MTDTSRAVVFTSATVTDETGKIIGTAGYWADKDGSPITDPERIKEIEAHMATTKGAFKAGDRVEILDDDGEPTGRMAEVVQEIGAGTYLVQPDDARYPFGTMSSGLRKADKE